MPAAVTPKRAPLLYEQKPDEPSGSSVLPTQVHVIHITNALSVCSRTQTRAYSQTDFSFEVHS